MNDVTQDWVLCCEYLQHPIGVENPAPRFSWGWEGDGISPPSQLAYRILVTAQTDEIVWDSGKVESRQTCAIVYAGSPLQSAACYRWNVSLYLADTQAPLQMPESMFETGLLHPSDWQADWIGAPTHRRGAAPLLRRSFALTEKPTHTRLYLSGLGYAEVTVNGTRPDESRLDPGWTDYQKTVLYRVWDVTHLLVSGENVLCVELGEGWHGLEHPGFFQLVQKQPPWLSDPKLLCRLVADDVVITSCADESWLTAAGPVQENNVYDGELYDARLEQTGWRLPGYVPTGVWKPAVQVPPPGGVLRCQLMSPISETQRIKPHLIDYPSTGENTVVVDLGVNIAGWVEIAVKGTPGQKVVLRYAEVRHPDGHINPANLRNAAATDTYILGKEETVTYAPRFTYHGFRYVQIDYDPGVVIYQVTGVCVHTALRQTGFFSCANEVLNRSYQAVLRTEQNNLHSVPTDCPQRDERLGWMNDVAVRCEETMINFDTILFFEKWLQDIADAQDKATGALPDTAPYFFGSNPGSHPTSTFLLLPWYLYLYYGDIQPIQRYYEKIKRHVDYKLSTRKENGILDEDGNYGDWAPPMTVSQLGWGLNAVPANINQSMLTTTYLFLDCTLAQRFADILGFPQDALRYGALAQQVRQAVNHTFLHKEGYYSRNAQGENIFALYAGLVPEEQHEAVLRHFLQDLREENNWHVTTGNQMTKYMFEVLGMEGLGQDAFQIAASEDYPSIGFMLKNGATTIWERWENLVAVHMNSHDHPMLGAYSVWFQKYLAGIRIVWTASKGCQVHVAPVVPQGLSEAKAQICAQGGTVACCWQKHGETLTVDVSVPWNKTVQFTIPDIPAAEIFWNGLACVQRQDECLFLQAGQHHIFMK